MAKRLDKNKLNIYDRPGIERYDSLEDFERSNSAEGYVEYEEEYDFADDYGNSPEAFKDVEEEIGTGKKVWNVLRPIVVFAASILIVVYGVYYVVNKIQHDYFDPVNIEDTTTKEVEIPRGSSLSTISEILYDEGIIRNKTVFKFYADFTDVGNKLKAGTYDLSPSMEFDDIIYKLRKGMNTDPTSWATLREGFTIENYADTLVELEVLENKEKYLELCKTAEGLDIKTNFLLDVIEENNNAPADQKRKYVLEGYLFPDTYEFFKYSSASEVIMRQIDQFIYKFDVDYYTRAEELGMTIDEIITLASLIEREAKTEDFAKVSAVFHNRLRDDIPLGSDAALAYAFDVPNTLVLDQYTGREHPYNTHLNTGLPPGPIGNPGEDAIKAALYPDSEILDGGYLFFALGDPETGETIFSKDSEAHQAVIEEYRPLWEQADAKREAEERGEVYVPPFSDEAEEDGENSEEGETDEG